MSSRRQPPPLFPDRAKAAPSRRPGEGGRLAPLADRVRPATLTEFVGQEDLLGEGKFLSSILLARPLPSLIFWGPPGSGKSTLARIIAAETDAVFLPYSAVLSGIREIKDALADLKRTHRATERP